MNKFQKIILFPVDNSASFICRVIKALIYIFDRK